MIPKIIFILAAIVAAMLLLKSCIVVEKHLKNVELSRQDSYFLPKGDYYFVTKKYFYSEVVPNLMSGGPNRTDPVYKYGINDKNNKVILKPFSVEDPQLVKLSEYDNRGNIHQSLVWWSVGEKRSSRFLPFISNSNKNTFYTMDGRRYANKSNDFCILQKSKYKSYLLNLKTGVSVSYVCEMQWKSPTEIFTKDYRGNINTLRPYSEIW